MLNHKLFTKNINYKHHHNKLHCATSVVIVMMISDESMQFMLYFQPACNFHGKFISKRNKMANLIVSLFCDGILLHKAAQPTSILYIIKLLL